MSSISNISTRLPAASEFFTWGMFWFLTATAGAFLFFGDGIEALLRAWQKPEYSHGPIIPLLSLLLFLRQLKDVPVQDGPISDRWPGVLVIILSIMLGAVGRISNIDDIIAYALILWVGGILLVSFGWKVGKHFWPPVVHLAYMLPLPDTLYYKTTTYLQYVSSELGAWFLRQMNVPVFLEGNIIDLGVTRLHVAEACSGLRYLFPIMSFSYVFAVLYRGPVWHKAILLLSAVPITILMNSVRIAVAGYIVNRWGVGWVDGFTHFFEGWVIFLICVLILFLLAWIMLHLQRPRMSLVDALDLDTSGLVPQLMRIRLVQSSGAMIASALLMLMAWGVFTNLPERGATTIERTPFALFPHQLGDWYQIGPAEVLTPKVAQALQADDYHSVTLRRENSAQPVGLFMAWYNDQSSGGIHPPEVCLPASGWEIAWLERVNVASEFGWQGDFNINRAIIQRGEARMMVYYWFDQKGRKVAWDMAAKFYLISDALTSGRTDGGLVRLTTPIAPDESDEAAAARLNDMLRSMVGSLPRFLPMADSAVAGGA
jgi:exosortase D (VPLPA-CTERM-specific)